MRLSFERGTTPFKFFRTEGAPYGEMLSGAVPSHRIVGQRDCRRELGIRELTL
jgi:hypothetical protein